MFYPRVWLYIYTYLSLSLIFLVGRLPLAEVSLLSSLNLSSSARWGCEGATNEQVVRSPCHSATLDVRQTLLPVLQPAEEALAPSVAAELLLAVLLVERGQDHLLRCGCHQSRKV
mmetsp:Transcript_45724/g.80402  ORF Transcript_45724/g.80402 Transcript_45724/m.80402 type:complete len:115 (-) Transcript_45724:1408-1752(-)